MVDRYIIGKTCRKSMLLPSIKMMMPVPLAPSLLSFLFLQNKKQNFQAIHDVLGHRNALKSMLKIEGKNGGCEIQHFQLFPNFDQTSLFFSFPPFFLYIKLLLPRSAQKEWMMTNHFFKMTTFFLQNILKVMSSSHGSSSGKSKNALKNSAIQRTTFEPFSEL